MDVTQAIQRLLTEREDLQARIDEIDRDLQVLNKYADSELTFETVNAISAPAPVEQARSLDLDSSTARAPTRPSGPQALLRKLLKERPGQVFTSKTAYELLRKEARWSSESLDPVNVVRSALAQLHAAGDLKKLGRGRYSYEPRQLEAGSSSFPPAYTPMDPSSAPDESGSVDQESAADSSQAATT